MTYAWNSTCPAVSMFSPPMPPSHNVVAREVAVLRTLAHLGWLTTEHLHALCFPGEVMATVRTTLRHLEDAGWICHARWRIKATSGSNVWGIGYKGPFILRRYGNGAPPQVLNLTRPSTAIEHAEWSIRSHARLLLVQLILHARAAARLAHIDVRFADAAPTQYAEVRGATQPDAVFTIAWTPPVAHAHSWLPWLDMHQHHAADHAVRYAVIFDRSAHVPAAVCAPAAHQRIDAAIADHTIVVVPRAAQRDPVQAATTQHAPSVVVLTWNDIAPQAGDVLRRLHLYGQQSSLPQWEASADER